MNYRKVETTAAPPTVDTESEEAWDLLDYLSPGDAVRLSVLLHGANPGDWPKYARDLIEAARTRKAREQSAVHEIIKSWENNRQAAKQEE